MDEDLSNQHIQYYSYIICNLFLAADLYLVINIQLKCTSFNTFVYCTIFEKNKNMSYLNN